MNAPASSLEIACREAPTPRELMRQICELETQIAALQAKLALAPESSVPESATGAIDRSAAFELELRSRAVEAMPLGLVISDASRPDVPIVYCNRGFEQLTGYSAAEVLNRNCRFLQGAATDPAAIDEIRAAIRERRGCSVVLCNYRKGGIPFWNALSVTPLRGLDGRVTHFVGVQTDITAVKEMEEQLRQSQKMEAMGRLAGGVAHDFNNLLTVIVGCSELLIEEEPPPELAAELIRQVREAGSRAAALTRELLSFSRKQPMQLRTLCLNSVIGGLESLLGRLIGREIVLRLTLQPELWPVRIEGAQIEQVILNLVVNARDAIVQTGTITVRTENVTISPPPGSDGRHPAADQADDPLAPATGEGAVGGDLRVDRTEDAGSDGCQDDRSFASADGLDGSSGIPPGDYVRLSVSDTGIGMDKKTQARIFEPFFTTKEAGKGTGLGLPTVINVLKQARAHLRIASEPGRGTTFSVYLPAAVRPDSMPAETAVEPRLEGLTSQRRGQEIVLLAESDEGVRSFMTRTLQLYGYTVLAAASLEQAQDEAARYEGPIHLLIADLDSRGAAGERDGRWAWEQIRRRQPEIKLLSAPAFAPLQTGENEAANPASATLRKPFTTEQLAIKVREALESGTGL